MFTIDLTVRYTPVPLSVQRKEAPDAEALYQQIITAMQGSSPTLIELTCDKQTDKKIAVLSDCIIAVIVSQKSGAASTGRVPGFLGTTEES